MSNFTIPTKVVTGVNTRWSYANVWDPKSINGGKPKYSVSLIIPKSDTAKEIGGHSDRRNLFFEIPYIIFSPLFCFLVHFNPSIMAGIAKCFSPMNPIISVIPKLAG